MLLVGLRLHEVGAPLYYCGAPFFPSKVPCYGQPNPAKVPGGQPPPPQVPCLSHLGDVTDSYTTPPSSPASPPGEVPIMPHPSQIPHQAPMSLLPAGDVEPNPATPNLAPAPVDVTWAGNAAASGGHHTPSEDAPPTVCPSAGLTCSHYEMQYMWNHHHSKGQSLLVRTPCLPSRFHHDKKMQQGESVLQVHRLVPPSACWQ